MNIINDYIEGRLGGVERVLYKASVIKVDVIGGKLAGPSSEGGLRSDEPPNPPGSFVGRVITDAADTYTDDDHLPVFWPIFPHDLMPIKESEHAYVMFEDPEQHHGVWLCRIPEPNNISNLNITPGTKRYTEDSANELQANTGAAEKVVQDLDEDPGVAEVDSEFDQETDSVPALNCRVGDRIIQGSNNATIMLGRDRISTRDTGEREAAGTIDLVTGRESADLNMSTDAARVYISAKTNGDTNFELTDFGDDPGVVSYVISKADEVRLVARGGIKLVVEDGPTSIVMQGGNITINTPTDVEVNSTNLKVVASENIVLDAGGEVHVGTEDASHPLVRADNLKTYLDQVFDVYNAMVVDVAGIPGLGVANSSVSSAVKAIPWDDVPSNDNKVE